MNGTRFVLAALCLATAFVVAAPGVSAHDAPCGINLFPVDWNFYGCGHNVSHRINQECKRFLGPDYECQIY